MKQEIIPYSESYDIFYITYYPDTNEFYDSCGFVITNIFEFITPNDLYLFRHGVQYTFQHRLIKGVLCEFDMEEGYHDGFLGQN